MEGRRIFVAGEILTAANVQSFLQDQAVMVFDDSTARGSAIPSPTEGMVTYLKDTNLVEAYTGAAFTPVGRILQVLQTVKTDTFTSTATTFSDITGLSVTITPTTTTSKILVSYDLYIGNSSSQFRQFRLLRDSTAISVGDAEGSRTQVTSASFIPSTSAEFVFTNNSAQFLDSPATTSATTYKVQLRQQSGTVHINRSGDDSNGAGSPRSVSHITVMEVAG